MSSYAASIEATRTQPWVFRAPPAPPRPLRRGLPLTGAANGGAIVARVAQAAPLDAFTRQQLERILTVTVEDWVRK